MNNIYSIKIIGYLFPNWTYLQITSLPMQFLRPICAVCQPLGVGTSGNDFSLGDMLYSGIRFKPICVNNF